MPYDFEGGRKKKIPLVTAKKRSEKIVDTLNSEGFHTTTCGSIRRGKEEVGDVDLVIRGDMEKIKDLIKEKFKIVPVSGEKSKKTGKEKRAFTFLYKGYQFNCYCCTEKDEGSMILFLTGSKGFNIVCRARAKSRGMLLNQYGLWMNTPKGLALVSSDEQSILEDLDMGKYADPRTREVEI